MIKKEFIQGLRFRFLTVMFLILFISTVILSVVITINEKTMLRNSLTTKGQSLASFITKLSRDPLLAKDSIQLDSIVNDANKDEDIAYTVIHDEQGNLLTSQYASINYRSPRLVAGLSGLSRDSEFQDIINAVKKQEPLIEISAPIMIDIKTVGKVTVGLSRYRIEKETEKTLLLIIALNLGIAFILGAALFAASKKIILDPVAELAKAASRLAKGDLSTQVIVKTTGEMQLLVDSFNQMSADLNKTTVSKDYVDNIIKSMTDTLIVTSPDRKIVLANAAACKLLGYEEKELIDKPVEMIFEKSLTGSGIITEKVFAEGFINNVETVYQTKNGGKVQMLFSGSAISGKSNNYGIVCAARDITEIKKLEYELLKLQKLESVGILAGGIAHDFNNLLAAILGSISLAEMFLEAHKPEKIAPLLEQAKEASEVARELSFRLLTFSKGGEPVRTISSVEKILRKSAGLSLSGSNVTCYIALPHDLYPVEIDEGQMTQVFNNILINAKEAMPRGGEIRLSAKNITLSGGEPVPLKEGNYVEISIKDSGIGIAAEDLPKIFDPYFSTKEVGSQKGSGLGLSISYSIVKKHEGHLSVESRQGTGTTFHIFIPASKEAYSPKETMQERRPIKQPVVSRKRILLMDDNERIRDLTGNMIEYLGYEVAYANNGEEAIELYRQSEQTGNTFHAVILDLTVQGGMGGTEAVQGLLDINPGVKAVISSGYADDPVLKDFRGYGFADAIAKPYKVEQLKKMLDRLFSSAQDR